MTFAFLPPFGSWLGESVRALILLGASALVFWAGELLYRRGVRVEYSRKFVHFAMGLLTLTLPWLFASALTLLLLSVLFAAAIYVAKRGNALPSVFGVERASLGELYFPLAVLALFLMARDEQAFYVVSILTLVICDSVAAIFGKEYGRHRYRIAGSFKSVEGSILFCLTAFLAVHLPLLLATDIERFESVLIAAQLALLVTSFEAISGRGSDNLFVPIGTYYLLVKMTRHSADTIALQLSVQLAILIVVAAIALRTHFLSLSGAIAAQLVLYAAYSLGGPRWIVAPILSFLLLFGLGGWHARQSSTQEGRHPVRAIFHVSIVAMLAMFADNSFVTLIRSETGLSTGHPFHTLFVGALAAACALASLRSFDIMPGFRRRPRPTRILAALALGYLFVVPLAIAVERRSFDWRALGVAALLCLFAAGTHVFVHRRTRPAVDLGSELRAISFAVLAGTLLVLPLQLTLLGVLRWELP